jgi:glycosyltransferase involved in cell wall biosynthesis
MTAATRIAIIGSARYAIREPFAGGLEAHTWALARALRHRGHEVTVFAGPGCDPALDVQEIPVHWPRISQAARADVSMTADGWLEEHHAYLTLMLALSRTREFDVVHNNCLHHLPIAMAPAVPAPMVTTLHTPPTPWLESAIQAGPSPITFVAVSEHTARAWRPNADAEVIRNGVDLDRWPPGPGGGSAIWFGRMVPEKGADLAIAAARTAGLELELVGPVADPDYFEDCIRPHLGPRVRYLGHLDHAALADRVGAAAVTLVTPRWDEPYGLVVAESLACGTPVAGFDRGGVAEVLDPECGVLVDADDVPGLAQAAVRARSLSRAHARARAVRHCSLASMIDAYESLYARLTVGDDAA